MKIVLNEEEKSQISSQHEEIDSSLFNFLMRRIKKENRKLDNEFYDNPLEVTNYTFEGLPGYGFTNLVSSKKDIQNRIFDMLYENDIIDYWPYDLNERDPQRVKLTKTIRKFINFILTD
jgi:hypothetical protein